jgi:hypothetical protein
MRASAALRAAWSHTQARPALPSAGLNLLLEPHAAQSHKERRSCTVCLYVVVHESRAASVQRGQSLCERRRPSVCAQWAASACSTPSPGPTARTCQSYAYARASLQCTATQLAAARAARAKRPGPAHARARADHGRREQQRHGHQPHHPPHHRPLGRHLAGDRCVPALCVRCGALLAAPALRSSRLLLCGSRQGQPLLWFKHWHLHEQGCQDHRQRERRWLFVSGSRTGRARRCKSLRCRTPTSRSTTPWQRRCARPAVGSRAWVPVEARSGCPMRARGSPAYVIKRCGQVREQKPCYINICCNLAGLPHPSFASVPVPFSITPRHTNEARRPPGLWAGRPAAVLVLAGSTLISCDTTRPCAGRAGPAARMNVRVAVQHHL